MPTELLNVDYSVPTAMAIPVMGNKLADRQAVTADITTGQ